MTSFAFILFALALVQYDSANGFYFNGESDKMCLQSAQAAFVKCLVSNIQTGNSASRGKLFSRGTD